MSATDRIKRLTDEVTRRQSSASKAGARKGRGATGKHTPKDWYQIVSDRASALLQEATHPSGAFRALGYLGTQVPVNGATGKVYTGMVNRLMLSMALPAGSTDPRFATFNQAKDKGWHVRAGEKAAGYVLFYKPWVLRGKDEGAESDDQEQGGHPTGKMVYLLRGFPVFHASQIEGIPTVSTQPVSLDAQTVLREMCQALAVASGLTVEEVPGARYPHWNLQENRVFWNGRWDDLTSLSMLAHELVHASSRVVGRQVKSLAEGDAESYAREELVAEIGAATLRARLGLADVVMDNHSTAYLDAWRRFVAADKRNVFRVMREAAQSVEWLCEHAPTLAQVPDSLAGDDPQSDFVFDLAEMVEQANAGHAGALRELFGDDAASLIEQLRSEGELVAPEQDDTDAFRLDDVSSLMRMG